MRMSRGRSPKIEGTAGGGLSPVGRLTCLFRWSCEARLIPCIQIGEKLFSEFLKAQLRASVQMLPRHLQSFSSKPKPRKRVRSKPEEGLNRSIMRDARSKHCFITILVGAGVAQQNCRVGGLRYPCLGLSCGTALRLVEA